MIAAIKKQVFRGEGREMVPHGEAGQAGRRISGSLRMGKGGIQSRSHT